jgi:dsDNA-binding SOS-regulon protein
MREIPLRFLLTASTTSLSEYQLRRLNESANAKSKARELLEEAIDNEVEARLACWLRTHRDDLFRAFSTLEIPNEDALRMWLAEHGEELVRLLATGPRKLLP